ncbi:MAG: hypothetical protein QF822_00890 [Candidatus Poseidoniia archaeon]|jgi:hypothetical protein|nr:hypothetical protein [Euryarchaeota archaeon]MDP6489404.1 hypothetical protein [Candidatus Poseidoniia archaeon]MDP6533771.1 hypothetical protein [Candidatus Poseidoniia archaeon]MDP6835436.1 hypothetical protein [Candidatus Poseidoniia archaeon]HIH78806.1 hypothetical protein [Candidatus Poseidoniia archaeon]|tara:strand:- start:1117 stop:1518 length:402 start_codon:yes stop_codon:yes gene_type:complete
MEFGQMRRDFADWRRENMLALAAVGTILSGTMVLVGAIGTWYRTEKWVPTVILEWLGDYDIWSLVIGLALLGVSSYQFWLVRWYMNRFEELIAVSSKAQFQRDWTELQQMSRYQLPSNYWKRALEAGRRFGLK